MKRALVSLGLVGLALAAVGCPGGAEIRPDGTGTITVAIVGFELRPTCVIHFGVVIEQGTKRIEFSPAVSARTGGQASLAGIRSEIDFSASVKITVTVLAVFAECLVAEGDVYVFEGVMTSDGAGTYTAPFSGFRKR